MAAAEPTPIVVDARRLRADAATIALLARLQLDASRLGRHVLLRGASAALRDLLTFSGLDEVLRVEPRRQPEQREERRGVQEERELGDPAT